MVKKTYDKRNANENKFYYIVKNNEGDSAQIFGYSLENNEETLIYEINNSISEYEVGEEYIFYITVTDKEEHFNVYRCNMASGEEELVYHNDDEELGWCHIYDGYTYIVSDYSSVGMKIYRCREGGDFDNELEDLDNYFPDSYEGDTVYRIIDNLTARASYYDKYGKYVINDIRENDTWQPVIVSDDEVIKVGDNHVTLETDAGDDEMRFSYQINDGEKQPISCLLESKYDRSVLYQNLMTCEDGKTITGIMNVSSHPSLGMKLSQLYVKRDIIFTLDTETGESQVVYDTKNNRTRIIGYKDNTVYLFKDDYKIYSQSIEGGELTEIAQIPETKDAYFDWQGDYLVIGYIPIDAVSSTKYEIITISHYATT
jgi:hypothetical protein